MIYINLEKKDNERKIEYKNIFHKFLYTIINKIKRRLIKLKEEKIEDKTLITIPDLENKTLNKLSNYMVQKCVNRVCISEELFKNPVFMDFIRKKKVRIFDGRWLFKQLVVKCAEYIVLCKKEKMEYQEVSILSKNIDELVAYNVREIASKVKIVNLITENVSKFRKLERELYEQKGIILNMNNNYKKSLAKNDIIFNFDFDEEELNKYTLPKKACILNLKQDIKINTKTFEGINACFYEISMPRKYLKDLLYFKDFDIQMLYESYIYKNTNPYNIKKELDEDELNIVFLESKNGKIRKTEYLNLSKKMAN